MDAVFSDDVILPLVASGDLQILVRTGQLALGVESVWKRFSHWATTLNVVKSRSFVEHLTSLSDAEAEELSKHETDLYLSGLTSLTDKAAKAFMWHEGTLNLNGLTNLSDAAAKGLLRHVEGDLSLDLDELPESAAEILRQHPSFQDDDDDEDWDEDDE